MKKQALLIILLFLSVLGISQTTIWSEDFSTYADPSGVRGNGTNNVGDYPSGVSKWTLDVSDCSLTATSDWFYVTGGLFSARDLDGEAVWTSESINISGYTNISISIDLSESGTMENADYINVYYKLDGGTETAFATNGSNSDDFTSVTASQSSLSGSSLVIVIRCRNNSGSEYHKFDNIIVTGTPASSYDNESIITKASGWSEPTNIAYSSYNASSALTGSNSLEVAKFTIKDGGSDGTDSDSKSTKLTDLSFTVDNYADIAALAIFDGTSNLAEVSSVSATTSFSSLTLEAADEGSKDFSLRATFKSAVTDNDKLKFTISSATADTAGSTFAASDAGGAATDNSGNNNKIVVSADRLAFIANKPPASVNKNKNFNVEVEATDANGNRDLDASHSLTLAKATGTGTLSSSTGLTQSLSSGLYSWTDVQYDVVESFTISASASGLSSATSSSISCVDIPDLVISEVADPGDNANARFVELYNNSDATIDFSTTTFYLCRQANGSSWGDIHLTGSVASGAMYVVAYSSSNFSSAYGFSPDAASGYISGNGDDGYFVYYGGDHSSGTLVDAYGVINEDGTGKAWEYKDSRSVRTTNSGSKGSGAKGSSSFSATDWSISSANVSDMTPGVKDGNQGNLPIELISFGAEKQQQQVLIRWETASERNNRFFTLERSDNGVDFTEVTKIAGAGNSNIVRHYEFTDEPGDIKGTFYYRLKQTDYDGHYSYSTIIGLSQQASNTFEFLHAELLNGQLSLKLNSGISRKASLRLFDINGRNVYAQPLLIQNKVNTYRLELQGLSRGLYFIRLSDENGRPLYSGKILSL